MIINTLSTIVAAMNSGSNSYSFDYGKSGYYNLSQDEGSFPAVIYDTESTFSLTPQQSGYIGEVYRPILFFLFKSELDFTPAQHDTNCITPAIAAAREFITRCQNANDIIDSITVVGDALQLINLLDVNASGIQIQFEIKLRITASECLT